MNTEELRDYIAVLHGFDEAIQELEIEGNEDFNRVVREVRQGVIDLLFDLKVLLCHRLADSFLATLQPHGELNDIWGIGRYCSTRSEAPKSSKEEFEALISRQVKAYVDSILFQEDSHGDC